MSSQVRTRAESLISATGKDTLINSPSKRRREQENLTGDRPTLDPSQSTLDRLSSLIEALNTKTDLVLQKLDDQAISLNQAQGKINTLEEIVKSQHSTINTLNAKVTDLEDRAREVNLVFHGLNPPPHFPPEKCIDLVKSFLLKELAWKISKIKYTAYHYLTHCVAFP